MIVHDPDDICPVANDWYRFLKDRLPWALQMVVMDLGQSYSASCSKSRYTDGCHRWDAPGWKYANWSNFTKIFVFRIFLNIFIFYTTMYHSHTMYHSLALALSDNCALSDTKWWQNTPLSWPQLFHWVTLSCNYADWHSLKLSSDNWVTLIKGEQEN